MKTIAVATTNEGKMAAVQTSFERFGAKYGWGEYNIVSHDSQSGVDTTPTTDEVGLIGCANRLSEIRAAMPHADIYLALEGIVCTLRDRSYIRGWTMIEDVSSGRIVSASGASVEVPQSVSRQIRDDQEFNHLVRDTYPMDEQTRADLRNIGANGAFTQGEYGRQDSFYDGIRICLALLANPNNW